MDKKIENSIKQLANPDSARQVCRRCSDGQPMPSVDTIQTIIRLLRAVIFPGYFGNSDISPANIDEHIRSHVQAIHDLLLGQIKAGVCFDNPTADFNCDDLNLDAEKAVTAFITQLPDIRELLLADALASYNGDPASKSIGEVIFSYPGLRAISSYRFAHALLRLGVPIIPRIITELAHSETGIDIHPGAKIGRAFMIDHGTGVVIGETAVIGNNVRLYQGVTLGARSFPLDANGHPIKGIVRHPTLEDDVIVYANSTILGAITIGKGTVIGGNIWVDKDIAPGSRVLQRKGKKKDKTAPHHQLQPDTDTPYSFDPITNRPTPPFRICQGCTSKKGCRKCRKKYEKKYGSGAKTPFGKG